MNDIYVQMEIGHTHTCMKQDFDKSRLKHWSNCWWPLDKPQLWASLSYFDKNKQGGNSSIPFGIPFKRWCFPVQSCGAKSVVGGRRCHSDSIRCPIWQRPRCHSRRGGRRGKHASTCRSGGCWIWWIRFSKHEFDSYKSSLGYIGMGYKML